MEGSELNRFKKDVHARESRVQKEGAKHAKSEALKKKMQGKGEYSKLSFTPKSESERKGFKKRFQ